MRDTNPTVLYEKSDAHIGGIVAFGVILAVMIMLVQGAAALLFDQCKERDNRVYPPLPPLAGKERPHLPDGLKYIPQPRLQTSEILDLAALRKEENSVLTGYGWVDRKAGIVRIPIEESMRLLADPKTAEARGVRVRVQGGSKK